MNSPINITENNDKEDNISYVDIFFINDYNFQFEDEFQFSQELNDVYSENLEISLKEENEKNKENIGPNKKETKEETVKSQLIKDKHNMNIKKAKKQEIFELKKINRKRGRLNDESKSKHIIAPHNEFSDDNIIIKIKARFLRNLMNFINLSYSAFIGIENSKLILMIDPSSSRNINRKDSLDWFEKKIKDVFSCKISSKYKKFKPNENIIQIRKFYEKEKNSQIKLIRVLGVKVRDVCEICVKDEKKEGFEELNNFYYDKKQLENKMYQKNKANIKDYLEKYEEFAKNLEEKFKRKEIRNYTKK